MAEEACWAAIDALITTKDIRHLRLILYDVEKERRWGLVIDDVIGPRRATRQAALWAALCAATGVEVSDG